jgi:hypothetical protein
MKRIFDGKGMLHERRKRWRQGIEEQAYEEPSA